MARSTYPVYVTTGPVYSDRRTEREDRGRGRTSGRERDLVDYVHDRDRLPRPALKHREASRDGRRRHEYRYYSPHRSSGLYPRSRSEERTSPAVVKEVAHSATRRRGRRHDDEDDEVRDDDVVDRQPLRVDKDRSKRHSTFESGTRLRGGDARKEGRRGGEDYHNDVAVKGDETHSKRKQAAHRAGKAAMTAGALEAVRQRGHHGSGTGDAWKRVATAALGAAAIDAAATKVRHKDPRDKGKGSMIGASIGGLVVDSLVHKLR